MGPRALRSLHARFVCNPTLSSSDRTGLKNCPPPPLPHPLFVPAIIIPQESPYVTRLRVAGRVIIASAVWCQRAMVVIARDQPVQACIQSYGPYSDWRTPEKDIWPGPVMYRHPHLNKCYGAFPAKLSERTDLDRSTVRGLIVHRFATWSAHPHACFGKYFDEANAWHPQLPIIDIIIPRQTRTPAQYRCSGRRQNIFVKIVSNYANATSKVARAEIDYGNL
ncbi:hypothetical protein J6590_020837 [Homalodisca vitripennis]|nr:hypothetical protein J6590_020837 [Homalodisca vitripennis]